MSLPIVENLSGPQESIFNLSRGPQLHFGEKSKNWSNFIKFIDFPPFPLFGVPWAAVIFSVAEFLSGLHGINFIMSGVSRVTARNKMKNIFTFVRFLLFTLLPHVGLCGLNI